MSPGDDYTSENDNLIDDDDEGLEFSIANLIDDDGGLGFRV